MRAASRPSPRQQNKSLSDTCASVCALSNSAQQGKILPCRRLSREMAGKVAGPPLAPVQPAPIAPAHPADTLRQPRATHTLRSWRQHGGVACVVIYDDGTVTDEHGDAIGNIYDELREHTQNVRHIAFRRRRARPGRDLACRQGTANESISEGSDLSVWSTRPRCYRQNRSLALQHETKNSKQKPCRPFECVGATCCTLW